MPSDTALEQSLRKAVQAYLQDPGDVPPSVNSLREDVEKEFNLKEGFFRRDAWKVRSKDIIQNEFDKGVDSNTVDPRPSKNGAKRTSASSTSRPRKKSKISNVDDDEDDSASATISSALSELDEDFEELQDDKMEVTSTKKTKQKKKPQRKEAEESDSNNDERPASTNTKTTPEKPLLEDNNDSSSELSSVLDDLPAPSKTKKTSTNKNGISKTSKTSTSKSKTKATSETSPDTEEIKRLQGWLVKCGIRKVWGKELKPYETPKAKISHLKSMLADAGMTGRYSNEKAASIKEARELAADIEAVQEGNERWGKTSDSDNDDADGRRRSDAKGAESSTNNGRRLVRGARNYDFLSSDGEETD